MPGQQRTTVTRSGLIYLAISAFILAAAVIRDINLLLLLFGMLAGVLLFNLRFVIVMLRQLEVQRRVPDQVAAGALFEVELSVANRRRWGQSWALVINDRIHRLAPSHDAKPAEARVMIPRIGPRQSQRALYRGRLPERGIYRFGPLRLSTRFPLGLVRRSGRYEQFDTMIVAPRTGRLTKSWSRLHQLAHSGTREMQSQQGMMEGDFHGLRGWRSGDSRRWIHWRTSARRGELMVRQFEQHRNQDLALLLDLWQPQDADLEQREWVEEILRFAATVVADVCRRGGSHLMIAATGSPSTTTSGPASMALQQDALEQLAVVEPTSEDRLPELLNQALDEFHTGSNTVIVSTRAVDITDTDRFAELWNDSRKRKILSKISCIDAGRGELSTFFQPE